MAKDKGLGMKGNEFYTGMPTMNKMKCPACGASVDPTVGTCSKCGQMGY